VTTKVRNLGHSGGGSFRRLGATRPRVQGFTTAQPTPEAAVAATLHVRRLAVRARMITAVEPPPPERPHRICVSAWYLTTELTRGLERLGREWQGRFGDCRISTGGAIGWHVRTVHRLGMRSRPGRRAVDNARNTMAVSQPQHRSDPSSCRNDAQRKKGPVFASLARNLESRAGMGPRTASGFDKQKQPSQGLEIVGARSSNSAKLERLARGR